MTAFALLMATVQVVPETASQPVHPLKTDGSAVVGSRVAVDRSGEQLAEWVTDGPTLDARDAIRRANRAAVVEEQPLAQSDAPDPADHREHAVLAPRARSAHVLAGEAQRRPTRQDLADTHGCGRASLERGVDLLAPAIVRLLARLRSRSRRDDDQTTEPDTDDHSVRHSFLRA